VFEPRKTEEGGICFPKDLKLEQNLVELRRLENFGEFDFIMIL